MSVQAFDTQFEFFHFVAANQADRVTRDGQLMIDDPARARRSYRQLHGDLPQGLHPARRSELVHRRPQQPSVSRADGSRDVERLAFHPKSAHAQRPEDYHNNMATIQWPLGPGRGLFPIWGTVWSAGVFGVCGNATNLRGAVGRHSPLGRILVPSVKPLARNVKAPGVDRGYLG
jgi:hypothetical protein